MNRARWGQWRAATGPTKASIFAELVLENEPLVGKFVADFILKTQQFTKSIHDDLFQAARIGIMQAVQRWDPEKGAFSTLAFHRARHEMQGVLKHGAQPISIRRQAHLPQAKQTAAAVFYCKHGREPTPDELGVKPSGVRMAEMARATYAPLTEADQVPSPPEDHIEAQIDRGRDMRALRTFLRKLPTADRAAFLAGKRPDLTAAAKAYVERRRETKKVRGLARASGRG